jgi:hypothetical protein
MGPKADIRYKPKGYGDIGKPFRTGADLNHGGRNKNKEKEVSFNTTEIKK